MARRSSRRAQSQPFITPKTLLSGAVGIISIPFLFGTYMVLAITMLPTMVAYFVDGSPKKFLFRCVGSVNVCGSMPALIELWYQGQDLAATGSVLLDPIYWLWAYGSAAVGWALFAMVPRAIATYVSHKAQKRVASLRKKQARLVEEWGKEVAREVRGNAEDGDDSGGAEPLGLDDDDDDDDAFGSLPPPQSKENREKMGSSAGSKKEKPKAESKPMGAPAYDEDPGDIELPDFEEGDAPAQL